MSTMSKLRALYNLPMREAVYILRNKVVPYKHTPIERVLHSKQVAQPSRFYNFLNRYETILERASAWQRLDFAGKTVMEVGCGDLLGFLLIAVFRGAGRCVAVEPGFNFEVFSDPRVEGQYFKRVWNDCCHLFGQTMDHAEFMRRVRAVEVHDAGILDVSLKREVDVFLSNSCLEHVHPLEESIMRLGEAAAPGARFLHLVNYGNHGGTAYPFKGMYTREPDAWFAANGRSLNLKRHPDVLGALRAAGFETSHYTLDQAPTLAQQPAPWWSQHYGEPDLLKRVVIYHGQYEG